MYAPSPLTRRGLLLIAAGACVEPWNRLYAASDFWNKKEPSQWSGEEIGKLVTRSPWAHEVTVSSQQRAKGGGNPGGSRGGGGGGGMGRGGRGGGGGMGIPNSTTGRSGGTGMPGGGGAGMEFRGVVCWESAKPVMEAKKGALPEAFAKHYVISVSGIPIVGARRQRSEDGESTVSKGPSESVLERIKGLTYLEPKGKSPAQPGIVQAAPKSAGTLLFGFSREILQLTPDDKEVTFTSQFGNLQVKTKFNLKDMLYRKELAL
jgi:hypothetical protein